VVGEPVLGAYVGLKEGEVDMDVLIVGEVLVRVGVRLIILNDPGGG